MIPKFRSRISRGTIWEFGVGLYPGWNLGLSWSEGGCFFIKNISARTLRELHADYRKWRDHNFKEER